MSWPIINMLPTMGSGVGPGGNGSFRRHLVEAASSNVTGTTTHTTKRMEVTSSSHSIVESDHLFLILKSTTEGKAKYIATDAEDYATLAANNSMRYH